MWEPPSWPPPWLTSCREKERALESGFEFPRRKVPARDSMALCLRESVFLPGRGESCPVEGSEGSVKDGRATLPQATDKLETYLLKGRTPDPKLNSEKSCSQPSPRQSKSLSNPTHRSFSTLVTVHSENGLKLKNTMYLNFVPNLYIFKGRNKDRDARRWARYCV